MDTILVPGQKNQPVVTRELEILYLRYKHILLLMDTLSPILTRMLHLVVIHGAIPSQCILMDQGKL